ncbi:MAG: hypothetical protein SynsKO_32340 [Synoicihabitans sp.]
MNILQLPRMIAGLTVTALSASALTIELDYSHDAAGTDFFGTYTAAKSALEKAASDISDVLNSSLGEISTGNSESVSGSSGSTTVNLDWRFSYTNPDDGSSETLETFSRAADAITIFVGSRILGGSTLGQGGPGGAGFSLGIGGFESEWTAAMAAAETASNNIFSRGSQAPTIGNISGSSTFGSTTANYSLNYGPVVGNLWFDRDTDNDGDTDTGTELNDYWHFDHTTAVDSGKIDFYSVALHEILHAIGYGVSDTWSDNVSGTDWLGPNAIAEHGTGTGLIDGGGAHITASISSTVFQDGASQEVVMDPNISTGQRKFLTDLDIAILQDLNYSAVPESGTFALLVGLVALGSVASRRRRRRVV